MNKIDVILNAFNKFGYTVFTNDLSLNIFGIRADNSLPNSFDDLIGVFYKENGGWNLLMFEATTDAGITVLGNKFGGANGTLIMQPGQYFKMFKIGKHKGKYPALVQNIEIEVLRDTNKNNLLDFDSLNKEFGMFGLNLHRANDNQAFPSTQVDNWSWGCQVIRKINDWNKFWKLITKSSKKFGNTFSYALLNEKDLEFSIKELLN